MSCLVYNIIIFKLTRNHGFLSGAAGESIIEFSSMQLSAKYHHIAITLLCTTLHLALAEYPRQLTLGCGPPTPC